MKIAIVISGDYRTFDMCRKTMAFIDDLDNDIYFSTWNKTNLKNSYLRIDYQEDITNEKIQNTINRDIRAITIGDPPQFSNWVPNGVNMIDRWYKGLQLVKQTEVCYDFIVLLRPDLFFNVNSPRGKLSIVSQQWYKHIFYCNTSPMPNSDAINLNDFIMVGSPDILNSIITQELIEDFTKDTLEIPAGRLNWHEWWYQRVSKQFEIQRIPHDLDFSVLGRPQPNVMNWELAKLYFQVWHQSQIVEHIDSGGMENATRNWHQDEINKAVADIRSRILT